MNISLRFLRGECFDLDNEQRGGFAIQVASFVDRY